MDPLTVEGQMFTGTIKSYSPTKGYGFVTCDKIKGDLFFLHLNLTKETLSQVHNDPDFYLKDAEVCFTCETSPEGKATAGKIRLLHGAKHTNAGFSNTASGSKSKGKGKASSVTKGWGNFGESEVYKKPGKGESREFGKASAGKGATVGTSGAMSQPGKSIMNNKRVEAQMKSFNAKSQWGFANVDPLVGDYGDVFVHLNNLDESVLHEHIQLRVNDIIEMRLENVDGKIVARDVTLVPQEPGVYDHQWLRGRVDKFFRGTSQGTIKSCRINSEIRFGKLDMPASFMNSSAEKLKGMDVIFKVLVNKQGKADAKMVNPYNPTDAVEARNRVNQIIDNLVNDGYLDDDAKNSLTQSKPEEVIHVLPDLEFTTAENPSSFIMGALSHQRKGKGKGGKDFKGSDYRSQSQSTTLRGGLIGATYGKTTPNLTLAKIGGTKGKGKGFRPY